MDVYAFRIVVDDVDTCYRVLGMVHNLYARGGRFKDYIAIPKANGYQSLQHCLACTVCPSKFRSEQKRWRSSPTTGLRALAIQNER